MASAKTGGKINTNASKIKIGSPKMTVKKASPSKNSAVAKGKGKAGKGGGGGRNT